MYQICLYNNGSSVAQYEAHDLQDAFDLAVETMKKEGFSACYIYNETGDLCLHLTHSSLFGIKD